MRRVLAMALTLALARAARAEDADALVEQGLDLREKGRDEEALALFRRAFAASPSPRARAQIALAEQALGRWGAAEQDLAQALTSAADAWITRHRAALDGALATVRTHLGDLVVTGGVAGAEARVDGALVATLPVAGAVRLVVGTHTLEVVAAGYYPVSQPVAISPDAPARVALEMRARASLDASARSGDAAAGAAPQRDAPPSSPGRAQRIAGAVVAAAAAVPLALGFVGLGARASEVSAYNADPTCPGQESPSKPAPCQAHMDAAGAWETASVVGFVAAGALAAAGLVVVLTAPSAKGAALFVGPARVSVAWAF